MKKIILFLICSGLMAGFSISAQESDAIQDVNIPAGELNLSEPTLLPTSPLYFLKNVSRFLRNTLTFSPVRKAELSLKFANEKLLEARKLSEREGVSEEILKKALENHNREMELVKERLEKLAEKTPAAENFLDKLVDSGVKQQKILDKISEDFRPVREAVEQIKERNLETVAVAPLRIEAAEEFGRRLDGVITRQAGSEFRDFKNLEVLAEIELRVPAEAKDAIRQVQENSLRRLEQVLVNLPEDRRNEFENYVKEIPGSVVSHLGIFDKLRQNVVTEAAGEISENAQALSVERLQSRIREEIGGQMELAAEISEEKAALAIAEANEAFEKLQAVIRSSAASLERFPSVFQLRENARKRLDEAVKAFQEKKFGAAWGLANAALQNIKNALRIFEIKPERILEPAGSSGAAVGEAPRAMFCVEIWAPVCGVDGKTYSNDCYARVAGVKIAYDGECDKKEKNRERIEQIMAKAWDAIQALETAIGKLTSEPPVIGGPETSVGISENNIGDRLTQARTLLATAKNHYMLAKELLLAGQFADAYTRAVSAFRAAEKGLAILGTGSSIISPLPTARPIPTARPRPTQTVIITTPTSGSIMCGGFAGKTCPTGHTCKYDGNYPDASGICVPLPTKLSPKSVPVCQITPTNFEECARCGYPVMESYPRQCKTPEGRIFTEPIPPIR